MKVLGPDNPYVGPRPLRAGEPLFGRDVEARHLLNSLIGDRIVLLHSPSGAGKTSLIQAKLVPALQHEGFRTLPLIRLATPADDAPPEANRYVASTLRILDDDLKLFEDRPKELYALTIESYLDRARDHLKAASGEPPPGDGQSGDRPAGPRRIMRGLRTVLLFDQFEEILTLNPFDDEAKTEFFRQIGSALARPDQWALFAMREEYLAALSPYTRVLPSGFRSRYRLNLLTPDDAVQAVEKPAETAGIPFAEGMARKVVDNLSKVRLRAEDEEEHDWLFALVEWVRGLYRRLFGRVPKADEELPGPFVEPVQLQVVCRSLWSKLQANTTSIGEKELAASGDVEVALREYYEDLLARVSKKLRVRQGPIRRWVGRLITAEGYRGLTARVPKGRKGEKIVKELVVEYLVRAEERRGSTWYELAHDRLIEPIARSNQKAYALRNLMLVYAGGALVVLAVTTVSSILNEIRTKQDAEKLDYVAAAAQQEQLEHIIKDLDKSNRSLAAVKKQATQELAKLNLELTSTADPLKPAVQYFSRNTDPPALEAYLKEAGFDVEIKPSSLESQFKTNCIWYGKGVPDKYVRAVALAALKSGTPVQAILPFPRTNRNLIQIGANALVSPCQILAPEEVADDALSKLNCGQRVPIDDAQEDK